MRLFRRLDDSACRAWARVAAGIAAVILLLMNDDRPPEDRCCAARDCKRVEGSRQASMPLCVGAEVAHVARVPWFYRWQRMLVPMRCVVAARAAGIGRCAVAVLVNVEPVQSVGHETFDLRDNPHAIRLLYKPNSTPGVEFIRRLEVGDGRWHLLLAVVVRLPWLRRRNLRLIHLDWLLHSRRGRDGLRLDGRARTGLGLFLFASHGRCGAGESDDAEPYGVMKVPHDRRPRAGERTWAAINDPWVHFRALRGGVATAQRC